ncbi:MAG: polysaccharide deacetylase family protein [Bacteroidota bacterium]
MDRNKEDFVLFTGHEAKLDKRHLRKQPKPTFRNLEDSMVPIHKQIARKWVFPTIMGIGAERWRFQPSPLGYLILCYHGVARTSSLPYNGRHIERNIFEKHLQYYRRYFDVLPLDEVFARVGEERLAERPTLAITFDDGYLNNLQEALPLLAKYEMPATVFALGGALDGSIQRVWTDTLDMLRVMRAGEGIEWDGQTFRLRANHYYADSGKHIYDYFQTYARGERDPQIAALGKKYALEAWVEQKAPDFWRLMSPSQLQALDASAWVDVQFHTHSHYDLAFREAAEIKTELSAGKKALESLLQHEVHSLAFPFGRYTQQVKEIARELGFKQQLALAYQLDADKQETDILPRLNVSGTTNYYSQIIHLRRTWQKLGV